MKSSTYLGPYWPMPEYQPEVGWVQGCWSGGNRAEESRASVHAQKRLLHFPGKLLCRSGPAQDLIHHGQSRA